MTEESLCKVDITLLSKVTLDIKGTFIIYYQYTCSACYSKHVRFVIVRNLTAFYCDVMGIGQKYKIKGIAIKSEFNTINIIIGLLNSYRISLSS